MTVKDFMLKKFPTDEWMDCPIPRHHWETIQEYADSYHEWKVKKMLNNKDMSNKKQKPALPQTVIERKAFDVERRPNGDFFIYTFYWDDMGEKRWCANSITETELRRIADGINKHL